MARATGVTCDQCGKFDVLVGNEHNQLPPTWIVVAPVTATGPDDRKEICSNKCLKDLGAARYKAERETATGGSADAAGRIVTDEGRASMQQNGMLLQHRKGNHDGKPNPDCTRCQKAGAA